MRLKRTKELSIPTPQNTIRFRVYVYFLYFDSFESDENKFSLS